MIEAAVPQIGQSCELIMDAPSGQDGPCFAAGDGRGAYGAKIKKYETPEKCLCRSIFLQIQSPIPKLQRNARHREAVHPRPGIPRRWLK